jgi:HPt (histidine-containing phosphotransfer) domain-containing protein
MHQTNTNLLERAAELIDELVGHPSGADLVIIQAIDNNDLDELRFQVHRIEGELAQEHFHNKEIVVW